MGPLNACNWGTWCLIEHDNNEHMDIVSTMNEANMELSMSVAGGSGYIIRVYTR